MKAVRSERPVRSEASEEGQKERGRKDDIVSGYDSVGVLESNIPTGV